MEAKDTVDLDMTEWGIYKKVTDTSRSSNIHWFCIRAGIEVEVNIFS